MLLTYIIACMVDLAQFQNKEATQEKYFILSLYVLKGSMHPPEAPTQLCVNPYFMCKAI